MSDYKLYEENGPALQAGAFRYGIVAARFNEAIVDKLLQAALQCLQQNGAAESQITVLRVPGAFEIPLACQRLAQTEHYDALIALGCVIRGETPHFHYVCSESARGVLDVSLQFNLPIINGILTTDTIQQAEARAAAVGLGSNKGEDAAKAAMEMLMLFQRLSDAAE